MRFIKPFAAIILLSFSAQAQEPPPLNFTGHYDFAFSGIPFGAIDINFKQDAQSYDAESNVRTVGIVKIFANHQSKTTSRGTGSNFAYGNTSYETNYSTNKKKKYVKLVRKDGVLTEEKVLPLSETREVVTEAPQELKNAAYDPLNITAGIRAGLAQAVAGGPKSFVLDYFDGKRLSRATIVYQGEERIKIKNQEHPVYVVSASRKPLGGFTKKELSRMQDGEPPLRIYFSKDQLVPLRLELKMALGTAAATLRAPEDKAPLLQVEPLDM